MLLLCLQNQHVWKSILITDFNPLKQEILMAWFWFFFFYFEDKKALWPFIIFEVIKENPNVYVVILILK